VWLNGWQLAAAPGEHVYMCAAAQQLLGMAWCVRHARGAKQVEPPPSLPGAWWGVVATHVLCIWVCTLRGAQSVGTWLCMALAAATLLRVLCVVWPRTPAHHRLPWSKHRAVGSLWFDWQVTC
jgi:hypothetical protein